MKNILYALFIILGLGALIWVISSIYLDLVHMGYSIFKILWMTIQFIFYLYIAQCVHVIVHETGHLVFGLISGYQFISFRIFWLMWIKKKQKLCLKKYQLRGTGGQCLMAPPDFQENHIPFIFYQLGGCFMNMIFVIIVCIITIQLSIINPFLIALMIMGILTALVNGIPMQIEGVDNDGYFVYILKKYPELLRPFWLQLKVNEMLAQDVRLKDMPEIWFEGVDALDICHHIQSSAIVLCYQRLMDQHDFQKSYDMIEQLLNQNIQWNNTQKNVLLCDAFYCQVAFHRLDKAVKYFQALDSDFQNHIQSYLVGLRTFYLYNHLITKNESQAISTRQRLSSYLTSYPYISEIQMQEDLIRFINDEDNFYE